MKNNVHKIIALIKKTHRNPPLFHILYCSLMGELKKHECALSYTDDWSSLLILGASYCCSGTYRKNLLGVHSKNQLDNKVLKFLKEEDFTLSENVFKLKIILYYVLNTLGMNTFIYGHLLSRMVGVDCTTDYLICKLYTNTFYAKRYGIELKRHNMGIEDCFFKNSFNMHCIIKLIPTQIESAISPFTIPEYNTNNTVHLVKILETLTMYAKYTSFPKELKRIIPKCKDFKVHFKSFVKKEFLIEECNSINYAQFINKEWCIKDLLKKEYTLTNNKSKFIEKLKDFIKEVE